MLLTNKKKKLILLLLLQFTNLYGKKKSVCTWFERHCSNVQVPKRDNAAENCASNARMMMIVIIKTVQLRILCAKYGVLIFSPLT